MKKIFIFSSFFLVATGSAFSESETDVTHIASASKVNFSNVKKDCSAIVFYGSWCTNCTKVIRGIMDKDEDAKHTLCLISEDTNKEDALSYFEGKEDLNVLKTRTYLDPEGALGTALQIDGVPAVIERPKSPD